MAYDYITGKYFRLPGTYIPKPSRKHQELIDRMAALGPRSGIYREGKRWSVFHNGCEAFDLPNLAEAEIEVEMFEESS